MLYTIKTLVKVFGGVDLSKRQLEKIADQLRLLSWALGAVLTSSSGYNFRLNYKTSILIVILWVFLQYMALMLDKRSEQK